MHLCGCWALYCVGSGGLWWVLGEFQWWVLVGSGGFSWVLVGSSWVLQGFWRVLKGSGGFWCVLLVLG